MDLNDKMVAAAADGIIRDLTDRQKLALVDSGHGRIIRSTGRWVITDAGTKAVRQAEAAKARETA
jgi:hypothetical protein